MKQRVLLVDDSTVDRLLATRILEKDNGCEIVSVDSGYKAKQRLLDQDFHLVVTDLVMPEMDGLALVEWARSNLSRVPVIVMTSVGTEANALRALEKGAVSFVPKQKLAERLNSTVEKVLSLSKPSHPFHQVVQGLHSATAEFQLDTDFQAIPRVVNLIRKTLSSTDSCDATEAIRIGLALEEALLNAMIHGNLELTHEASQEGFNLNSSIVRDRLKQESYCDRKVSLGVSFKLDSVEFRIEDSGPGFDYASSPNSLDVSSFEGGAGRGLVLMNTFMDEVEYYGNGAAVRLTRRFAHC